MKRPALAGFEAPPDIIGNFTSFDFGYEGDPFSPATLHKYLYTGANPVMNVDPTGHFFISIIDVLASGGINSILASMQGATGQIVMNQFVYGVKAGLAVSAMEGIVSLAGFGVNWLASAVIGKITPYVAGRLAPLVGKLVSELTKDTVKVFRIEGAANARILVNEAGQVAIQNTEKTLFLNFGSRERAIDFLEKRLSQGMKDASIKSFDVPRRFLDDLRESAVPEALAKKYPTAPISVDVTKAPDQFGLRAQQIEELADAIIQGSGRIEWP